MAHPEQAVWLGTFFPVNAAFFMALFFLIAGYFTAGGLARDGAWRLIGRRAVRLGPPALLVGFLGMPVFLHISGGSPEPFAVWYWGTYLGRWQVTFAHTWFLIHLLVYTAGAACLARLLPHPPAPFAWTGRVTAALLLLLILGVWGGRVRLFETMPRRTGLVWLSTGAAAAALRYGVDLIPVAGSDLSDTLASLRRVIWPLWETIICFGLCLGLPVFFRSFLAACPAWIGRLADVTLTAYVVHVFVLVPLQLALTPSPLPPTVLFLIVTAAGAAITFAMALAWSVLARRLAVPRALSTAGGRTTDR